MEKLKIWDLELGKIYRAFYKGDEADEDYKVESSGKLLENYGFGWEESNISYNILLDTTFEEIKREIDWSKVPRGTKVQVKDREGGKWVNKYFIKYESSKEEYLFQVNKWQDDDYTGFNMEQYSNFYKYCRIHPSVEIPDEWYKEVKE